MSRIFTDEELVELGKKPSQKVEEAIKSGDTEKALAEFAKFNAVFDSTHDMYGTWVAECLTYIYKHMGQKAAEECMREHTEFGMPGYRDWLDSLDYETRVRTMIDIEAMHNVPLIITEDDKAVTIQMSECAAGLRQVKQGVYDEPHNCAYCKADPTSTWGVDHFPIYCIHAPLQDQVAQEIGMKGFYYQQVPDEFGSEACKFVMFKNYDDHPDEYWTRVGRKRPNPGETIHPDDAK